MIVSCRLAPGRSVGPKDFHDLTTAKVLDVGWSPTGDVTVEFDRDLTDDEAAAVRRRLVSATPEEEVLRERVASRTPTDLLGLIAQVQDLTALILGE